MPRFLNNVFSNLYKILLIILGLVIVFYVLIAFRLWSMEWTDYFLKRGQWEEIIFVSLIIAGISLVVLKLFRWYVRLETR